MPPRPILCLAAAIVGCAGCVHSGPRHASERVLRQRTIERAASYGLVDVTALAPDVIVDLRYGTGHNIAGRALYPACMPCLLRESTADRVRRAQAMLSAQGYRLGIWDAWRPPEVQNTLNEASGRTGLFLAPEKGWSRHCGGISVDATLLDRKGREIPMPSAFDEKLGRLSSAEAVTDPVARRNLQILHGAMRAAGLIPLPDEWWHFDDTDHVRDPVPIVRGGEIGLLLR